MVNNVTIITATTFNPFLHVKFLFRCISIIVSTEHLSIVRNIQAFVIDYSKVANILIILVKSEI